MRLLPPGAGKPGTMKAVGFMIDSIIYSFGFVAWAVPAFFAALYSGEAIRLAALVPSISNGPIAPIFAVATVGILWQAKQNIFVIICSGVSSGRAIFVGSNPPGATAAVAGPAAFGRSSGFMNFSYDFRIASTEGGVCPSLK